MGQLEGDPGVEVADALGSDLGWLLGQALRAYRQLSERAMADLPGGIRGHLVLTVACNGCVTTQLGLARQLGLDRTVMTHLIDDLESAGLIQRIPQPNDRRAKQVVVTDAGRARWERATGLLTRAEDHLLAGLDGDARATLRGLLRQIAAPHDGPGAGEMCSIVASLDARGC